MRHWTTEEIDKLRDYVEREQALLDERAGLARLLGRSIHTIETVLSVIRTERRRIFGKSRAGIRAYLRRAKRK